MNHRYKGKYHYAVPAGWMNDPNGCIFYNREFHIFYQSNPHKPFPEFVGWGHVSTKDFLKFTQHKEALWIEHPYENYGCWSGSAVILNHQLHLLYTGNGDGIQQQCNASSCDEGETFAKHADNPVMRSEILPPHTDVHAWRDPYIYKEGDTLYVLTGARDTRGYGKVLTYSTTDLVHFEYVGEFIKSNMMASPGIFECPSLSKIGDSHLFVSSVNFARQKGNLYQNFATTIGMLGVFDPKTGKFNARRKQELDSGTDYYAPQIISNLPGRVILVGWMQMWERNYPTQQDGWVGSLALPREVTVKDGHIHQFPVKEILQNEKTIQEISCLKSGSSLRLPSSCHISFSVEFFQKEEGRISFFEDGDHFVSLSFDPEKNLITMDRSHSGTSIFSVSPWECDSNIRKLDYPLKESVRIDLFLDVSSAEIFFDNGRNVMSLLAYPNAQDTYSLLVHGCNLKGIAVRAI